MNHTEKRHPRTLTEAFGPYTSNRIDTDEQPYHLGDLCVVFAGLLGIVIALAVVWQ